MCLAFPLKIVSIDGKQAVAELKGVQKTIRIDFIKDIRIDDYVLVHAGFAIEKIDKNISIETWGLLKEMDNV
ncbi:HypC/HybG/HupF family hydrogenase formation chaperone [Clostridium polynesiense]|uniref:HypC/HybG/HupF family hydrogenase formation chaperone n=1 Tax=Clostridium polynesiense TaxID=1325933 RepID=UPI00058CC259|nr:HypC/HybG/HupF family hydrogenase formation chaperone [Clostridium polynesiense]